MRWLISTSLHLRVAVIVLASMLVIFGISEVRNAPLDVFPEFAPPLVEIQTEAPGLSTAEVESLISTPIENAVNGVIGLKTLRSRLPRSWKASPNRLEMPSLTTVPEFS
jgi:Cu/Ag efflux pump CusA